MQPGVFATPARLVLISDPPSVEHPASFMRLLVELSFYLLIVVELFPAQLGLSGIKFLAGGVVAGGGLLCFFAYHAGREQLPKSLYFILAMNVMANLSLVVGHGEAPILGDGLTELFHWITYALMISYLVRNRMAEKRLLVFMAATILLSVYFGGVEKMHFGRPRLELQGVGGNFKNANDLAYYSGLVAIALLFRSVKSGMLFRILLCLLAFGLILVCARTVSRGGLLALTFGITLFMTTIVVIEDKFKSFLTVTTFLLVIAGLFAVFSAPVLLLLERIGETSYGRRVGVYLISPLEDMLNTLVLGMGQSGAVTGAGISAHNSFMHTHIAYGGLVAYIYVAWMIWLGCGVWKCWFDSQSPREVKVFVLAIFTMMVISHIFSNRGYLFLSSIYVAAMIEKYTMHLRAKPADKGSHREIMQWRRARQ